MESISGVPANYVECIEGKHYKLRTLWHYLSFLIIEEGNPW